MLNCEGTCKLKSCELDPRDGPAGQRRRASTTLLDVIGGTSTRLVHLSIDLVFSGTRGGGHVEDDETDPVTVYGKTMVEAERHCSLRETSGRRASSASRCRWASASTATPGRSTGFRAASRKGKPATLYFDEVRTPTYTDCLNPLLATCSPGRDITGLYHAGGPRRLSLFQIAQIVNRVGGYDPAPACTAARGSKPARCRRGPAM